MSTPNLLALEICSSLIGNWDLVKDFTSSDCERDYLPVLLPAAETNVLYGNQRASVEKVATVDISECGVIQNVKH